MSWPAQTLAPTAVGDCGATTAKRDNAAGLALCRWRRDSERLGRAADGEDVPPW